MTRLRQAIGSREWDSGRQPMLADQDSTGPSVQAADAELQEPRLRRGAGFPLWLACLLLVVTALSLVAAVIITSRGTASINRLATLRLDAEVLLTELKDIETGQRGFLVTGKPQFLEPYNDARPRIASMMDHLVEEAVIDPALSLATLRRLTRQKLDLTDVTIVMAREGRLEQARTAVGEGEGKRVMDAIRAEIQQLSADIDQRRGTAETRTRGNAVLAAIVALTGAVLASLLVATTALLQRRQSADRLRLSEESRARALDAAGLGAWELMLASDRLVADVTMRRLFDLPAAAALSVQDLIAAVQDSDRGSAADALRGAGEQERFTWEGWVGAAATSAKLIRLQAALYHDQHGRPTVLRGVAQDVTVQRATEQRMQAMQAELLHATRVSTVGETASATAHELSQPLSAAATLFTACDMTIRSGQLYDREELLNGMSRGLNAIGSAADIVRNLRRFLRKEMFTRERLDVDATIRQAVQVGAVGFERRGGGRITWDLTPSLPPIEGDRIQVQQVLVNLVRNAVEAMAGQPGAELRIGARLHAGSVQVSVGDNGPGLPPELRDAPFRPFVTTKPSGLGLGLCVCKKIVDAHNGRIDIASMPGGTTVTVEFPVAQEEFHAAVA
jgi:C4-dicarboxylate-specific signal transduction histidine kinase